MDMHHNQAPVMTVKDWVITMLITAIPLVGFVMLFVWGFSDSENPSKSNWAKATLIMFAIGVVLYILFFVLIFGAMFSSGAFDSM